MTLPFDVWRKALEELSMELRAVREALTTICRITRIKDGELKAAQGVRHGGPQSFLQLVNAFRVIAVPVRVV